MAAAVATGLFAAVASSFFSADAAGQQPAATSQSAPGVEKHLRNIRKLTSGGENAEAYFSADGIAADLSVDARPASRAIRSSR